MKRRKRQGALGKRKCFFFFDHHFDIRVLTDELVFIRASPVHHLKVEELNTVVLRRKCCRSVRSSILIPSCKDSKMCQGNALVCLKHTKKGHSVGNFQPVKFQTVPSVHFHSLSTSQSDPPTQTSDSNPKVSMMSRSIISNSSSDSIEARWPPLSRQT